MARFDYSKKRTWDDNKSLEFLPSANLYHSLTPNQLFEADPTYLLWIHRNIKSIKFTEGIRKKLNKYRKSIPPDGEVGKKS